MNSSFFLFYERLICNAPLFPCCPVLPFPCFLVSLFPCSPVTLFPHYPVSLFSCSPVILFPVTLFPSESVESFPCSSVNLKFFTQMKRPHNSVNGRGIFTCCVSERLISIFHRFWKGPFQELKCLFYVLTFALVSLRNEAKLKFFLTNENIWLFSFFL